MTNDCKQRQFPLLSPWPMKAKKCIVHLNKIHFAVILVMLESFISSRDFQGHGVPGTVNMLMQTDIGTVEQTLTSIGNWVQRRGRMEDRRKRGRERESEEVWEGGSGEGRECYSDFFLKIVFRKSILMADCIIFYFHQIPISVPWKDCTSTPKNSEISWDFTLLTDEQFSLLQSHGCWQKAQDSWVGDRGLNYS